MIMHAAVFSDVDCMGLIFFPTLLFLILLCHNGQRKLRADFTFSFLKLITLKLMAIKTSGKKHIISFRYYKAL